MKPDMFSEALLLIFGTAIVMVFVSHTLASGVELLRANTLQHKR